MLMLNGTITTNNLSNCKPENSHVVTHESVVIDAIHSQAFLFGEDMGKFKRTVPPLCACGCGKRVTWNKGGLNQWNKFIFGHQNRGENSPHYGKDKYAKEKAKSAPLCACGCGKKTKWCLMKKQYNKYIHQHQNIGKKRPELSGKNHPMYGKRHPNRGKKIHSEKTRKFLSEFAKALGKNHPSRSPEAIAKRSGKNHHNYGKKLSEETKLKLSIANSGSNSSRWKGGISCEPYCQIWGDEEYKQSIKDRDNNECQNPDCWGKCNHLPLVIHHINYIKKNCHPWNIITVCRSCNVRANNNREWWTRFYQNIMTEQYGYKYE